MKKNIFKSLVVICTLALLVSCEKEAEVTKLSVINFPQTFASSTNTVVLTKDNGDSEVVAFSWDAVSYGIKAMVTYSLQFDIPSDTVGPTAWSKAQEIMVGEDILTRGITGYELNKIALEAFALEPGVLSKMVVRVKSYVDRNAYSNVITLNVNPYIPPAVVVGESLWVANAGWSLATAPTIVSVNSDKLYEGYIYIPAGGSTQIKFTSHPDLTHNVYGDAGAGLLSTAATAGYISLPSDGYYELSADLNTMKWTATKTAWAIIGGATPGGWTTETKMTYDAEKQVWTVTCDLKADGNTFKFRANNEWKIDMSVDGNGKLVYVDNPLYPYNPQPDIPVTTAGNYTITLDLHVAGQYSYKMKLN